MSRTDQYIGLTRDAESYVSGLDRIGTTDLEGAFYNIFHLGIWRASHQFKDAAITEILQDSPWSSGPMFFTHLRIHNDNGLDIVVFSWVLNPSLDAEYDYERGHYYI